LIAHRGESFDAPENTLASFALAWERGDEAIELDVRLTSDRRLVVCHDEDTQRTFGHRRVVADSPFTELQALGLPSLEQVLSEMPAGKRAFVEIKVGPEAMDPLVDVLHSCCRPARDVVIISFHDAAVAAARTRLAEHEAYLLIHQKQESPQAPWAPTGAEMIRRALDIRAHGLDIAFNPSIDAALVEQAHAAGLKLLVWTIDDAVAARRMLRIGVDGITTNRAAWLRDTLSREEMR
jgi:glycerophosphoryl diester phosphodiesterase